ncbi:MAG: Formate hydrogenlyase transcriptional activator [Pelotomaculum sp. PtaU1.Bin065]|nr:MAG: Formate hydrogenlyase transcriptional activator [Pelotomaculum sp. PtaU1.Bin065]
MQRYWDLINSSQDNNEKRLTYHNKSYIANRISIFEKDTVIGSIIVLRDVTEMDKISVKLKSCEELNKELEGIIASSYDGILITDGEGKVLKINESLLRITNLTRDHFIGNKIQSLYEDGHIVYEPAESLARDSKKIITGIQKIRTGEEVMVTSTPVFDDDGNVIRIVTNARDMSEIVNLQEQLARSRELSNHLRSEFNKMLEDELRSNGMITSNPEMYKILGLARRVACSEVTFLIQGESGVGKEVLAKLIHIWSKRPGAFIKVNCGAIPQHLLESELFGYDRGAFTGANKEGKPGLFELAGEGTLFLDEVEDLPLELQGKFLQVIQDREFIRLGGTKVIKVNVRLIAASNKELRKMVVERTFREDLFYRLNVVPVTIPPLRERKEDIPLLVNYFLNKYNNKYGVEKSLAPGLLQSFMNYHWPGNIRELKNVVERLIITCSSDIISDVVNEDILVAKQNVQLRNTAGAGESAAPEPGHQSEEVFSPLKEILESVEKDILSRALKKYKNSRRIGRILGISHTAVLRKIRKYKL